MGGFLRLPPLDWRTRTIADLSGDVIAAARFRRVLRRPAEVTAAISALVRLDTPALLVVDYAENVAPLVGELIDTIVDVGAHRLIRVLLLARSPEGWWRDLSESHAEWIDPVPLALESLTDQLGGERTRDVWLDAVHGFTGHAQAAGFAVAGVDIRHPPTSFGTTLELYADALLRVLDATAPVEPLRSAPRDPLNAVLMHERRQVSALLHGEGLVLAEADRDWAMATVVLREAVDIDAASDALRDAPGLAALSPADRRLLAQTLHRLYPSSSGEHVWQAPQPDRIAEIHLLDLAQRSPSDADWISAVVSLCDVGDVGEAFGATTTLRRCLAASDQAASDQAGKQRIGRQRIELALRKLIATHPNLYVPVLTVVDAGRFAEDIARAVDDGADTSRGLPFEAVMQLEVLLTQLGCSASRAGIADAVYTRLSAAIPSELPCPRSELDQYARTLYNRSAWLAAQGRDEQALALSAEALQVRRQMFETDPAANRYGLSAALSSVGTSLGKLGRHEEALAHLEEAIEIHRELVDAEPRMYGPALANGLHSRGVLLALLGRPKEALAATEEAASIYATLIVLTASVKHATNYAVAVEALAVRYGALRLFDKALIAAETAVDLCRDLAARDPDVHSAHLALALGNLGNHLSNLKRYDQALPPTQEAVAIYRRLAAAYPEAFAPHLARVLCNLGDRLAQLGRYDEALPPAVESVHIRRRLAARNLTAHQADLARSLTSLGAQAAELHRWDESLSATTEAVGIYGELAVHLPDLANALSQLSTAMVKVRRLPDALAAAREAVDAWRLVVRDNPAALPDLARGLQTLASRHLDAGQPDDSVEAAQEAVLILRELVIQNTDAHEPDLAAALNNLCVSLAMAGRFSDALPAAQEAVDIRRHTSITDPAELPALARALTNLSNRYAEVGQLDDSLAPAEDAVTITRTLAEQCPAAHLPDHATMLANLGLRLIALGDLDRALRVTEQAAGMYFTLANAQPSYFVEVVKSRAAHECALLTAGRFAQARTSMAETAAVAKRHSVPLPTRHTFMMNLVAKWDDT